MRGERLIGVVLAGFSLALYSVSAWAALAGKPVASVLIGVFASVVLVVGADMFKG